MSYGRLLGIESRDLKSSFLKLDGFDFGQIRELNYIGIINLISEEVHLPNWTNYQPHIQTKKFIETREQSLKDLLENESLQTHIFPIKWLVFYTRYNDDQSKKCWEIIYFHKIASSFCHKINWWLEELLRKIEANSREREYKIEPCIPCAPTNCEKEFKFFAKPKLTLHVPDAVADLIVQYCEGEINAPTVRR